MFKIVPFSTLPLRVRRTAATTDSPWKWAASIQGADAMKLFWGARGPDVPAAKGSFAQNLGENVFFDFHDSSDGSDEWLVFMTNDVEI